MSDSLTSRELKDQITTGSVEFEKKFTDIAISKNDKLQQEIRDLVETVYKDILGTEKEKDKTDIEILRRNTRRTINEVLKSNGGISIVFDRAKSLILEEVRNGKIDTAEQSEVLEGIRRRLQKIKGEILKEDDYGRDRTREQNDYIRNILCNDKLLERVSLRLGQSIRGYCKKASVNTINLLTNNRYRELAGMVRKGNVRRALSVDGTQSKAGIFKKMKEMKGLVGKLKNPKTWLRMMTVKRPKLKKTGFLGLYNKHVYQRLIDRVEEFNEKEIKSGDLMKRLKKEILKSMGSGLWKGIKGLGGKILGGMTGIFKSVWKIAKSVMKLGAYILKSVKMMMFTPAGQWLIGFVSGVIYHGLIKPIIEWFKPWIKKIIGPIKRLFGFKEDEEITVKAIKLRLYDLELTYAGKITSAEGIRNIDKISSFFSEMGKIQDYLDKLEFFIDGGGWQKSAVSSVGGALGTIGALIGSIWGPLGAIIGGGIGGIAASFVQHFADKITPDKDTEVAKSSIVKRMRERWMRRAVGVSVSTNISDRIMFLKSKGKRLDEEIKNEKNEDRKKDLQKKKDDIDRELGTLKDLDWRTDGKDDEKVGEMIERLKDKDNYFSMDLKDISSIDFFMDNAMKGVYQKVEVPKDSRYEALARAKKESVQQAIIDYNMGKVTFEGIRNLAAGYLKQILGNKDQMSVEAKTPTRFYGGSEMLPTQTMNRVLVSLGDALKDQDFEKKYLAKTLKMSDEAFSPTRMAGMVDEAVQRVLQGFKDDQRRNAFKSSGIIEKMFYSMGPKEKYTEEDIKKIVTQLETISLEEVQKTEGGKKDDTLKNMLMQVMTEQMGAIQRDKDATAEQKNQAAEYLKRMESLGYSKKNDNASNEAEQEKQRKQKELTSLTEQIDDMQEKLNLSNENYKTLSQMIDAVRKRKQGEKGLGSDTQPAVLVPVEVERSEKSLMMDANDEKPDPKYKYLNKWQEATSFESMMKGGYQVPAPKMNPDQQKMFDFLYPGLGK